MSRLRGFATRTLIAMLAGTIAVAAGIGINVALAAPKTPAPTITSGPANGSSTLSTSAVFQFTDSKAPATFACSLDGAAATTCTSPTTYSALSDGTHTFSVRATASRSAESDATTRTWRIDHQAPVPMTKFPAPGGTYNSAGFAAGCASKLCGTATDLTGVSWVKVAVRQLATGKWWNGSNAFNQTSAAFVTVTGTSNWSMPISGLSDGQYEIRLTARDTLGNEVAVANAVVSTFVIDNGKPSAPTITRGPDDPTTGRNASFDYTSVKSGVSYRCSLDAGSYAGCGKNHETYTGLDLGQHCFRVVAVDTAGNASEPSTPWCWSIITTQRFSIDGGTNGLLYPDQTQALNLRIGNPYNFTLEIRSVTVTVAGAPSSGNRSCVGPDNLVVANGDGSGTVTFPSGAVRVPASSTKTLAQLGVATSLWPQLHMIDSPTDDQYACKNATFDLTYSGTATK